MSCFCLHVRALDNTSTYVIGFSASIGRDQRVSHWPRTRLPKLYPSISQASADHINIALYSTGIAHEHLLHPGVVGDALHVGKMSIHALPETAVRAIGASQVLTDPSAVVKELVDNALDARATSIAVEIHANTLDMIQVRDNGHGIPPQDRPLVARRYCTSKLTDADDLASIGGSSLGFRGEALTSAAEMSGGMTITTRVEGEQVATSLKINQQGEVMAQERASTAIGTTVRITDFIKTNPVRRQVALKHTEQCLKRVKHLLQSFAFARPHVRFALKVLKAKNDKGNWMYAPKAGGNAEDAAFKIVGAACASQCTWSVIEQDGFTLQAFLPKSDATAEKVSNTGAFISVDRRPLTISRGLPKQIVKAFREALRKADPRFEGIKDPFLFLEITCSEQSYDPNIEPAKDDVLFEDPDRVMGAARKIFATVYAAESLPVPSEPAAAIVDDEDDFATSVQREWPQTREQSHAGEDQNNATETIESLIPGILRGAEDLPEPISRRAFRTNMYGCDEEDLDAMELRPSTGRTEADFEELRQASKDVSISNPWVMAKLNASNKQSADARLDISPTALPSGRHMAPRDDQISVLDDSATLPTPRPSSPTSPAHAFHPSDHVPDLRLARDGRVIAPLFSSSQGHHTPGRPSMADGATVTPSPSQQRVRPDYNYGVTPLTDPPQGTPLSAIPQTRGRGKAAQGGRANINRPFVSPVVNSSREKVWFDHLEGIEERGRDRPRRRNNDTTPTQLVRRGEVEDLPRPMTPPPRNRDIRDFVASVDLTGDTATASNPRKSTDRRPASVVATTEDEDENGTNNYGAISGRGFVPASELAALEARVGSITKPMAPPPPKRLKTGNRVLRQISGNALPAAEEEPESDREYRPETTTTTSTRRKSLAKLQRTKSSRLPLERTPVGKGTHNLETKLCTTPADIAKLGSGIDLDYSLLRWNEPAIEAYDVFAEVQSQEDDLKVISDKLGELLINKVSDGEMVQDLGELVKTALSTHMEAMAAEMEEVSPSQEMLDDAE
jgi:DNA mismatch repair protein MutL